MYETWRDLGRDWWVKLRHAAGHIDRVVEAERAYLAGQPWSLEPEPEGRDHVTNLRLRLHEPPPPELVLYAGDALHSLSSALDSIAFALAREHYGPGLDDDEVLQSRTEFPVRYSAEALESWRRSNRRTELFGERELRALWWGQSYYWHATSYADHGVGPAPDSPEEAQQISYDPLRRLRYLHKIDKHRRLHVALLGPDITYWGSSGDSQRRANIGAVWRDGEVVAQVYDPPSDAEDTEIEWGLRVVLVEEGRRELVVDELRRLHQAVGLSLDAVIRAMALD